MPQLRQPSPQTALPLLTSWDSLGAGLGITASHMAYALKFRDDQQQLIRLGDRRVYKSLPALRRVQSSIMHLLTPLFEGLHSQHALAYRKGLNAVDRVATLPPAHTLITFDMVKYYDNITLGHLTHTLMEYGFAESGARLVSRYCVVRRAGRQTLQQGSPASPVLSNMVGHKILDAPILAWLVKEYPEVSCNYVRYCDNMALFVSEAPPEGFADAFKSWVKEHLRALGFRTHKWHTIAATNPVRHQKFLGMVLNAEARAELCVLDRLRAILFNWCRQGKEAVVRRFVAEEGFSVRDFNGSELLCEKLRQHVRGHMAYISRINENQGLVLKKLLAAATLLDAVLPGRTELPPQVLGEIKKYRNRNEPVDAYLDRVEGCIAT